jgi:hypothetical protein
MPSLSLTRPKRKTSENSTRAKSESPWTYDPRRLEPCVDNAPSTKRSWRSVSSRRSSCTHFISMQSRPETTTTIKCKTHWQKKKKVPFYVLAFAILKSSPLMTQKKVNIKPMTGAWALFSSLSFTLLCFWVPHTYLNSTEFHKDIFILVYKVLCPCSTMCHICLFLFSPFPSPVSPFSSLKSLPL